MLSKLRTDKSGFTLIELMIVIAIIGILAAIAIPNFIAYRNKSFCSAAESDANGIAAAVSDYFAIPSHVDTPSVGELNNGIGYKFSKWQDVENHGGIAGDSPNANITITVVDDSARCPRDYMEKMPFTAAPNARDGWDADNNMYYKFVTNND